MAHFISAKKELMRELSAPAWQDTILLRLNNHPDACKTDISPLIALLSRPEFKWKAAWSLGECMRLLSAHDLEAARVIMRRMMWSMNEESGNLGWGIPEAMGAILARSEPLYKEYRHILLSYIRDTQGEDNYIDHAPLRQGAYTAVGYLIQQQPVTAEQAFTLLFDGLLDPDVPARAAAAAALPICNAAKDFSPTVEPEKRDDALLSIASLAEQHGSFEIFTGTATQEIAFAEAAKAATSYLHTMTPLA